MAPPQPGSAVPSRSLATRVRSGETVIGTFVKTVAAQTVEVLGQYGLDFVVLDAEHAPFGVEALDMSLCAAHAAGIPALVRVPDHRAAFINSSLDMGAAGIVAPHVVSAVDAEAIADAVKYDRGKRGFSPSGRAGRYGGLAPHAYRAAADAGSMIWCQIEDRAALGRLDEIAALDVVDCLFIGPADLGMSLGCTAPDDPRLTDAIRAIAEAGRRHRRPVGMFVSSPDAIAGLIDLGITVFICGSDQSLLLGRAKQIASEVAAFVTD